MEDRVLQALVSLADEESLLVLAPSSKQGQGQGQGTRLLTEATLVLLVPPYSEIKRAFSAQDPLAANNLKTGESSGLNRGFVDAFGTRQVGRQPPRLVISDKVRRLVLEPIEVAPLE